MEHVTQNFLFRIFVRLLAYHPDSRYIRIMSKIIITVGCPGAGKSTWAETNLPAQTLRLERDRFREMLWGSRQAYHNDTLDQRTKSRIIGEAMHAAARHWPADRPIALTDTGIHWSAIERFAPLRANPEIVVFDVQWKTLVERNSTRPLEHQVPHDVLKQFHDAMYDSKAWWRAYPHSYV